MRLIKTFFESYKQIAKEGGWFEEPRPQHVDLQVEHWVKETGASIEGMTSDLFMAPLALSERWVTLSLSVLYTPAIKNAAKAAEPDEQVYHRGKLASKQTDARGGNLRAPTMSVVRVGKGGERVPVELMAGVFPVEEGQPLHPDDQQAAPIPFLTPDSNLKRYGELFGNVGDKNVSRPDSTGSTASAPTGAGGTAVNAG